MIIGKIIWAIAAVIVAVLAHGSYCSAEMTDGNNVPAERSTTDFVYIDNDEIRVGFKKSSGVGIAHLQLLPDGENVINHWDRGRLVQQSYYGKSDGSTWTLDGKVIPWRWNPVQGGDSGHGVPKVLDLKAERDKLYSKTVGKNWGGGQDLDEVTFEQWVTLTGKVAHVKFRMTYTGETSHPVCAQELPAVFIEPQYSTLLVYDGDAPWTSAPVSKSVPGWPNESRRINENWAAYVNSDGVGVGVYVPIASKITCYRFGSGEYRREDGACSYFAPVKEFAITPGMVFDYDVYLTIGTAQQIRDRVYKLRDLYGKN